MKFIGQYIQSFIARFRNDVYLEDVSTGTIANGGHLGLDSNNKIVKAVDGGGDLTGVTITTDSGGGSAASDTSGSADFSILGATGVGVTNSGTTITATAVPGEIDHDSLLNFAANEHYTQANITTVGTIGTGVWQGTAIAHDYIGADAIEGDNIADNAVDSEHYTDGSIDTDHIADAQVTVAKLHADAIQTSAESFADNDTSLMTSAAIDDAIIKGGSVTYINILPHEFLADEGGGANKSAQYDDTDAGGGDGAVDIGVSVGSTSASLFAFTDIPVGKTATHVTVFGSNAGNAITVYESNVKTGTLTSKGTGNTDTGDDSNIINITDVAGTSTNYLVIKSAIAATTNTIYGAQVTISG